ncbi:MAG: outer membrane beta-barrel protein [Bacteroidetes bacterium]|nr:outer membrane beta-barrel protein [Bacteroidota bacterium]
MGTEMNQDELEQFLIDEVKDHRMYPSDQIWRNIQTEVNGHQTWPALTFISIFIISALTVSTLLNNHPAEKSIRISIKNAAVSGNNINETKINPDFNSIAAEQLTAKTFANLKHENTAKFAEEPIVAMPFVKADPIKITNTHLVNSYPTKPSFINENSLRTVSLNWVANNNSIEKNSLLIDGPETAATNDNALAVTTQAIVVPISNTIKPTEAITNSTDEYLKQFAYTPSSLFKAKNSKVGFGFFITPSTSYRKLSDTKAKEILGAAPATAPVGLNYTAGINNIVRHKPAVGLELGFAVLYNMTNRFKFKTGLQFNIRQYYIETFQSTTDITTISLINTRGVENISVFSPYNNNTGYNSTELDNKMYQVSVPIGLQYDLIKGTRLGITAEASIQPTITLNKSLYLLSTDYKHYADGNSLMRKWNVNSSFGLNITYKTGEYQWFLGPQARYQFLPTYSNKYPITEYLMDYGIRLGFIKQIK